ncbi:phosphate/phosphite/phosphonate ABC transporter substrate-binding protein [Sphingobacterium pedocola]|uniref:Phosphate/phosphite/phosphonate ABC transporter substrate-binding protein n=1 Tax=Sphingobacterium pedocola TaxID=2082722 RepID=A0ABR9TA02_9SPHI|nr:PhnD/SsuA/transferrin family substrate-binding protein [Sphingobacterium pedocola]MBE8722165.1 hypothetical protein [Sphingobacterium pedocola]
MVRINYLLLIGYCLVATPLVAQLRVATYRYAENSRVDNIRPIADLLAAATGQVATVVSYPSVGELVDAIQQGNVDVAFINTFGYLLLAADSLAQPSMVPLVVWQTLDDATDDNYRCIFIAPEGGVVTNSNDVALNTAERSLLLVSEGSTSGNLVPRIALSALGITHPEQQFKSIAYAGTHQQTAKKIALGEADLGAIGSIAYEDFIRDSTNRPIRLVWRSPKIPLGPVLVSNRLPDVEREQIANVLIRLHSNHPEAFKIAKNGWSEAQHAESYRRVKSDYLYRLIQQFGDATELNRIVRAFLNKN